MQSTAEPTSNPIVGANFWVRATAHTVDGVIILAISIAATIPLLLYSIQVPDWMQWFSNFASAAVVICFWRFLQATPGKMMFKLKIVDLKTGERPSWLRLCVRYVSLGISAMPILPFKVINPGLIVQLEDYRDVTGIPEMIDLLSGPMGWFIGLPLGLGFFWVLIDKRHRGWHDLISGTVTISTN